jgi:hypothetical protein
VHRFLSAAALLENVPAGRIRGLCLFPLPGKGWKKGWFFKKNQRAAPEQIRLKIRRDP